MEMWRNRTPFLKGRVLRNGRPSEATIGFCLQGSDSEANPTWSEIKAELEVDLPGGASSVLRGLFNGHRKMAPYVWPATRLPVKLHPDKDDKLVVDWKAWDRQGGLAAALASTACSFEPRFLAAAYRAGGEASETATATPTATAGNSGGGSGWQAQSLAAWQQAVDSGQMSQEEYDKAVADLRQASG
jgi:hypothetical protein